MFRRCDDQFKCPICDNWIIMTKQYCKKCKIQYTICKYYYKKLISPSEFQKYVIKYNFKDISYEYSWCKKYNEPIKTVVGDKKFYKKGLLCNEKYTFNKGSIK